MRLLSRSLWPSSDTVAPGDDFHAFATGRWPPSAFIQIGLPRRTVRDDVDERACRQLAAMLDDAGTSRPDRLHRTVADFRAALLNDSAIEDHGVEPLTPILAAIDGVADRLALARLLGSTMAVESATDGGDHAPSSVFEVVVEPGGARGGPAAMLRPGRLALGSPDAYVGGDARLAERRSRYQRYMARLLALAGFDHADRRARAVMALETAIAETHGASPASEGNAGAASWSRAELARRAPGLDWDAFFEAAGLGHQTRIAARQTSVLAGIAVLIDSRPLRAWQDYLRVRALDAYAEFLPSPFAEAAAAMRGDRRSRDDRALQVTQSAMAEAVAELCGRRCFSPAQRARVRASIANVATVLRGRMAGVSWLSSDSRRIALATLDALHVGHASTATRGRWDALRIDVADPIGNLRRLGDLRRSRALSLLDTAADPHEWALPSEIVGTILTVQHAACAIAAACLPSPKYAAVASEAAACGAIGAIIGRELGRAVDLEPLPLAEWRLDGAAAVADLAGLTAAFDASCGSFAGRVADRESVRRRNREFFIAYAHACDGSDARGHAATARRSDAVQHVDAWYAAFDVTRGQRLHLEPGARVRLW